MFGRGRIRCRTEPMSHQDGDISWQVLRQIVQEWQGTSAVELGEVSPLDGGSISTTLLLTTNDGAQAVLKISPYRVDRSYEHERHQLDLLRALGVPTPNVYQCRTGTLENPNSYLLMQFMPGVDLNAAKSRCSAEQYDELQRRLADIVIAIHATTAPAYGRVAPAESKAFDNWAAFYREIYNAVWDEAQRLNILPIKLRKQINKLHERLDRLLVHDDCPRLVHWDIWASNVLCAPNENGQWRITAVLDPMCKFAHAEAEIAYMDLFHTSTPAFNKAYQQRFKLDDTYHRVRKPIYQLYPLLNHLSIFGAEYMKPLMNVLEKVSVLV
jgi:fructosamine-3-kinase